jgi:hypothetical protein
LVREKKLRQKFYGQNRFLNGLRVALLLMLATGTAAAASQPKLVLAMVPPPAKLKDTFETRLKDSEVIAALQQSMDALTTASLRMESEMDTAVGNDIPDPSVVQNQPLTREAIRMWMQSYNAGPYALLKYKGNVPYKETQNYAPRVFRYYQQDLTNSEYEPYIQQAAAKWGMDPQLIRAIIKTESNFNKKTVSHAGARGLMQVMPVVWKEINKRYGNLGDYHQKVFDPETNIDVACAYLAWLRYEFLPRHFAEFEQNPAKPMAYVSDGYKAVVKDRVVVANAPKIPVVTPAATKTSPAVKSAPAVTVANAQTPSKRPAVSADSGVKITMRDKSGKVSTITSAEAAKLMKGTAFEDAVAKAKSSGQKVSVRVKSTASSVSAGVDAAVASARSTNMDREKSVASRKPTPSSRPKKKS